MSTPSRKHVIVVGAGPGGLTCAMILAHRGFKVTVLEAAPQVGGRNAAIRLGPYTFDTGPTFLMLKDILDEVFREAGADSDKVLDFHRLDPMYRLKFASHDMDMISDPQRMKTEIARHFPGKDAAFDRFMKREKERFRHLYPCLQKSYHKASALFSRDMRHAIPHLALTRKLYDVMADYFGDEELALSFTFQSKYLGMSPWDCPGVFAMIPYIEHAFGIYHTTGGLSRISEVMEETARRQGAEIRFSTPVKRILVERRCAKGVVLEDGEVITADDVVINADFAQAMTTLFEPGVIRKYTPADLARRAFSCSTFMLYLGVDAAFPRLPHHTIAFARNYRGNVGDIFAGRKPGADLSFYVRNATVTDPGLAPAGHSALYVLVPVPNTRGGINWDRDKAAFRDVVLDRMADRMGLDVRGHIVQKRIITPLDWEREHRVYAGATFNLAHSVGQMIYFRPHNQFEELDHTYLVGGGTHPGSGLPTIYESGRIAANLLSRRYKVPFVSANLQI